MKSETAKTAPPPKTRILRIDGSEYGTAKICAQRHGLSRAQLLQLCASSRIREFRLTPGGNSRRYFSLPDVAEALAARVQKG